jgi:hypothetical protein
MSGWSETLYAQFASRAAARTALEAQDVKFDLSGLTTGDERFCILYGPVEWITRPTYNADGSVANAGQQRTGFWVMARFNLDTAGGRAAYNAVIASGRVQTIATPSNVWAGD